MTPPLPTGPYLGNPKSLPAPTDDLPLEGAPLPLGPGVGDVSLNPVDSFIPMDDSSTGEFKSVQDLLNAIGDEQLFGKLANAKYQAERNKKYLKVTLAILEIRKHLRGDEKTAAAAAKKIEEWLSDPELLGDTAVAHQARVNLIKALKRAPKGQGIDEGVKTILEALGKNYSTKAPPPNPAPPKPEAPKLEEKPKEDVKAPTAGSLLDSLTDAKLFGDKASSYNSERNKKYLPVTMALLEIRKFAKGDGAGTNDAVTKIAAWLGDSALLSDPVAHQARLGLIQALGAAPKGTESFNKGVAELLAALKANYGKAGDAPKPAEPKPESDSKAKAGAKGLSELSVNPKTKTKDKREDDAKSLSSGLNGAVKPAMSRLLKKYDSLKVKCQMTISVDDTTGQVVTVSFKDIEAGGGISPQDTKELLEAIAGNIRARFRFKKLGDSGLSFFKVPLSIIGQ